MARVRHSSCQLSSRIANSGLACASKASRLASSAKCAKGASRMYSHDCRSDREDGSRRHFTGAKGTSLSSGSVWLGRGLAYRNERRPDKRAQAAPSKGGLSGYVPQNQIQTLHRRMVARIFHPPFVTYMPSCVSWKAPSWPAFLRPRPQGEGVLKTVHATTHASYESPVATFSVYDVNVCLRSRRKPCGPNL